MKTLGLKIAVLLVLMVPLKWTFEESLEGRRADLKLGGPGLSIELRAKLGQNLALGLLGGFRAFVADLVWLKAHGCWMERMWFQLKERVELAVLLQPHAISFWDVGAWHMAWNASYDEGINQNYPSQAWRLKRRHDWVMAGKRFLEEGIRNNPDHYDLYFRLGWLIYERLKDPMKNPLEAAPYFVKAASFPDAPLYVDRMVGRMYVKGGKTREAYEWWKKLWKEDHSKNPQQLWDKIAQWGHEAEEELGIPPSERVFPPKSKSATIKGAK